MSAPLRLVIFDVDGTLVDSQVSIVTAMTAAFQAVGVPVPDRAAILSIVGLSLDQAMEQLVPDQPLVTRDRLVVAYKDAYHANRLQLGAGSAPLYPGARAVLQRLHAVPEILLGIATGKSRRGLDALLEAHDLARYFITQQVADHHPSKPHPSMVLTAMDQAGTTPADTVMIGDTRFDMQMAQAAGVPGIGVDWGYHPAHSLQTPHILSDFDQLPATLTRLWGIAT